MTAPAVDLHLDTVLKTNASAVTALIAWRNAELRGADVGSDEWLTYMSRLRDAADRVLTSVRALREEVDALVERDRVVVDLHARSSSQAGVGTFVGQHFPPRPKPGCSLADVGLPCGHRAPCVECTPDGVIA